MNHSKLARLERAYDFHKDKVENLERLVALAKGESPIHMAVLDHFGRGLFPAQAALVDVFLMLYHDWLIEQMKEANRLASAEYIKDFLSDLNEFYDALTQAD